MDSEGRKEPRGPLGLQALQLAQETLDQPDRLAQAGQQARLAPRAQAQLALPALLDLRVQTV